MILEALLLGLGLWLFLEGALYAASPEAMQRFLNWAARLPLPELRQAGLWSAALGAILLYAGFRLN